MKARMNSSFPTFLSAFDPSDLPGGSMDPLGFDRAYSILADKVLPGLTNVAAYPRYFSLLCAGASGRRPPCFGFFCRISFQVFCAVW